MESSLAIEAKNLAVEFARPKLTIAFQQASFSISRGELVAVLGPSGCGKSTLLRSVAGFMTPTQGELSSFGEPIVGPSADRAILFQEDSAFPWQTTIENIAVAARWKGLGIREAKAEARSWISKVRLKGYEGFYPAQLSGGMRQRVGLARTFASAARILLLDEPFGALDTKTRRGIWTLLLQLWGERKCTVVLVTHDIDEAIFLADTIIVMGGSPSTILGIERVSQQRPRTLDWVFSKDGIELQQKLHLYLGLNGE